MAFHSEIKVNYQVLQEIVADLKKYETALISMEKSIANMDKVISENEGKTFDALRKVKHDFDGEIDRCKEEIKDIYGSIEGYISEMSEIIGASPAGSMLLVDRLDIWVNMQSIKNACYAIGEIGKYQRGMTVYTPVEGDDPARLSKIRRNTQRNREMQEAIGASSEKIKRHYESINRIYKNKIVKFENKDDEHESKLEIVHLKYTGILESFREDGKDILDFGKGLFNWSKNLVTGIGGIFKTTGALNTYAVCKLVQVAPPKWSKEAVESLKGITPWSLIESLCQSGSDSIAEEGWAYGAGYVVPDVVLTILGTKGIDKLSKTGKIGEGTTRFEAIVSKGRKISNGPGLPLKSISSKLKANELLRLKSIYMPSELKQAISKAGLTEYEFTKLRVKDVKKLTSKEVKALMQIRESIPMPDATTKMQKVIPIGDVDKYISGQYQIRNFVSRAEDGIFTNPRDAFDSLRLDYPGTKYIRNDGSVGVIRYSSEESVNAYIPYSPELGGKIVDQPPFTGNGFTKSMNGHVVPEFYQPEIKRLLPGAKIYELKANGEITEIAELIEENIWIRK